MDDWTKNSWIGIGSIWLAVIAGIVFLLSGCNGDVISDPESEALVSHLAKETPSVGSITPLPQDVRDRVDVYVDRSLSMQSFTRAERSSYFNVLSELDGLLAGSIQFYGFGFPSEQQGQVTEPINAVLLEEASSYTYLNNDYGALFGSLEPGSGHTHLVVSDGVQSDVDGPRFGEVVASIGDWIEQSGVFSLMVYRAPYRGTYYHEVPTTGRVQYNCDDRPFYIFGFFPSVQAKNEILEILKGGDVAPEHVITIGEASASVVAQENGLPPLGERRGPRVLASFTNHSVSSPNINHVYSGRPTKGDKGTPLHFEVRFDSTAPWTSLSDNDMRQVAESLEPSFRHWRIDTLEVNPENVVLAPTTAPNVFDVDTQLDRDQSRTAHLITSMAHAPGGARDRERIASVLTVGLSPNGANRLIPGSLSTRRDDRPSACNRTLNIQRTIGAVLREHYIVGRALLVTQWQK